MLISISKINPIALHTIPITKTKAGYKIVSIVLSIIPIRESAGHFSNICTRIEKTIIDL